MQNIKRGLGRSLGLASVLAITFSTAVSADCVQRHPILGVDIGVEETNCPPAKKAAPARARAAKSKPVARLAAPKAAARSETRAARMPAAAPAAEAADEEIREMQGLLTAVGYEPGAVDGRNSEQTRDAARAFRKAVGLKSGTDAEETIEVLRRISGR